MNSLKLNIQLNHQIFSLFSLSLRLHGTKIKGWKLEAWTFNPRVTLADFSKHSLQAPWPLGRAAPKSFLRVSLTRKSHNLYINSLHVGYMHVLSLCRGTVLKMGLYLEPREWREGLGESKTRKIPPWNIMPRYLKYFSGFKLWKKYNFKFIYFP